ncbi:hypothetical protein PILCRDRAFT_824979 [Piloderma croceum F 1598]|uniref:Uncharacterized protein n=1 Tax=Piloderma croceum (strain F 1598) TaxID=765440 RepID=A0A0C3FDU4_PILCF|nr:hypothetical protein PILCRDRAFT_824979 [Piloderma croceum F 1598]
MIASKAELSALECRKRPDDSGGNTHCKVSDSDICQLSNERHVRLMVIVSANNDHIVFRRKCIDGRALNGIRQDGRTVAARAEALDDSPTLY